MKPGYVTAKLIAALIRFEGMQPRDAKQVAGRCETLAWQRDAILADVKVCEQVKSIVRMYSQDYYYYTKTWQQKHIVRS